MQECGPSSSRVYCIFVKSTNRNVWINQLLRWQLDNHNKIYKQYTRDGEGSHSCKNLYNDIDELYCCSIEFLNYVLHVY